MLLQFFWKTEVMRKRRKKFSSNDAKTTLRQTISLWEKQRKVILTKLSRKEAEMEKKKTSKALADLPNDNHTRIKRLLQDLEREFDILLQENSVRK